jgi:hypothetical protein
MPRRKSSGGGAGLIGCFGALLLFGGCSKIMSGCQPAPQATSRPTPAGSYQQQQPTVTYFTPPPPQQPTYYAPPQPAYEQGYSGYGNYSQPTNTTVYVTRTGRSYHSSTCRHLKSVGGSMTREQAQAQGYSPCGTCGGG